MPTRTTLSRGLMAWLLSGLVISPYPAARAADHRDAPVVDATGEGDITDVFAFLDPTNAERVVLAMAVNPLAVPALTHSYRFSTEYLYQFKIDIDGDAREDLVVQSVFNDTEDGGQNVRVTVGVPNRNMVGATNRLLPNDPNTQGRVGEVLGQNDDVRVFTGLRDDPFVLDGNFFRIVGPANQEVFRDIPSSPIGPLRGRPVRADGRSGLDLFGGFNASFIVVSIPSAWVRSGRPIINIWGTVSAPFVSGGSYVQFERMGQPLFNTVFIPGNLKDTFNAGVPSEDTTRWSSFVPDTLTTTDNDTRGNTIAGRAGLLTTLGLTSAPNGAPLLLPANFPNTNRDLLRVALLPDVLRLNLDLPPNDLAIGQFGLANGRRPGDDVVDIALRLIRQLADVNFPTALGVPGSGAARAGALTFPDRRIFAVLQGTDFIRPDSTLGDLSTSGNDRPFLTEFPFFAAPHPRPGDEGTIGFPSLQ